MGCLPVLRAASLVLALLAGSLPALAGNFSVFPIRVDLGGAQTVASLTVRNTGTEPATIQLQPTTWRQQDGRDVLEPTRELLVTPPIFTVPPGGSQIVRAGLRHAPDAGVELPYRLILREILPEPKPGFTGLRVALELSVPVFVAPKSGQAVPSLQWLLVAGAEGSRLQVTNAGNGHVRIGSFTLTAPSGESIGPIDVGAYLLPGQARELSLPRTPSATSGLRVTARTGHGELAADVASGPAAR